MRGQARQLRPIQGTMGPMPRLDRFFEWLLRNRQTGEITIAQLPNVPLIVFIVAFAIRFAFHPTGTVGTVIDVVAAAALAVWALDEIVRGVNPWRRMLGGGVLAFQALALLMR